MTEVASESSSIVSAVRVETTERQPLPPRERLETVFEISDLAALYGSKAALKGVSMEIYKNSSRRSSARPAAESAHTSAV